MKRGRLEAFSDGLLAIVITIMVLEMKIPHGADFDALKPILPVFLTYVLSFVYLDIFVIVSQESGPSSDLAMSQNFILLTWKLDAN